MWKSNPQCRPRHARRTIFRISLLRSHFDTFDDTAPGAGMNVASKERVAPGVCGVRRLS